MAKRALVKFVIDISALPFILLSIAAERFSLWGLDKDISKSILIVNRYKEMDIPFHLLQLLVFAEDRRNSYHRGVDPIAMVRAVFANVINGESQGASTIEQQFVRVVSQRYDKCLSRKVREQLLALAISRRIQKKDIARAYLCLAFYGAGKIGIEGVFKIYRKNMNELSLNESIAVVSRLKYPEPLNTTKQWERKHMLRNKYILNCWNCADD